DRGRPGGSARRGQCERLTWLSASVVLRRTTRPGAPVRAAPQSMHWRSTYQLPGAESGLRSVSFAIARGTGWLVRGESASSQGRGHSSGGDVRSHADAVLAPARVTTCRL